ncbi:diguanylate cyclase [Azospira restricta]|uniref:Diguanylate cyclase n=1 Tax=Azospira restricta TaxID=404405 RepID=A0A974PY15_9RHOO|nr:diguanylate cyclase [Azospira restricta]QRJ63261.1 diguanylate cyclase [Azospira restricta]
MARSATPSNHTANAMRLLQLELDAPTDDTLDRAARTITSDGKATRCRTVTTALRHLNAAGAAFDLALICGDDAQALLGAYSALAASGRLPPTLVLSATASVDTAVSLLKAGADDFIVRDAAGHWAERLTDEAAALQTRRRALSERAQLDAELRESERRLAQIVDGSSVAMFVIDQQHRVTHWNRACEAMTGIAAEDVIGTSEQWRAFYAKKRPCMADLVLDGAIESRFNRYYGDKDYRRSTLIPGSYEAEDFFPNFGDCGRWLFFTAAPLHDSHGNVVGAIETLQDVTAQKRAEVALGERETLLRQIIQCSSVATFVIDREHRITHWNRAAEILLGRSADSAIGARDLAHEVYRRDRPVLADLVLDGAGDEEIARYYDGRYRRSATIDGAFEVEDFFPDLDGGPRWLHFAAALLHDEQGRTIGAIETLLDISERKRAEERIQESERRLAQIIDGSAVAAFVVDQTHRVTHWNRACAALTGVPASEVIGTRQQWRAFYPAERPCLADLVVDGAVEEKLSRYYLNKQFHRSQIVEGGYEAQDFFANFGNSGRWLYFTAAPLRNAQGEIVGAIETLQDITEQKRAEENLRQSEERYRVLSITDGMTGLYNARHFAQRLREEMDRCQRYQHPLALMLMDIDNFKQFNDRYGHVEGDQVLIRLAECITACLRRTDQAFRYGGEEFVVLLPETEMGEAIAAAERVRAMFAGSEIRPGDGSTVCCTASIGVTTFVAGETPRDFVARADSGTYEAKRRGKNRVIRIVPGMGNIVD